MPAMIQPGAIFRDNLQQLPPIDGVQRIDLVDGTGDVVASIENQPGKQGSLAVYRCLNQAGGTLDAAAAEHGLAVFAAPQVMNKAAHGMDVGSDAARHVVEIGTVFLAELKAVESDDGVA